eukprot:82369-Rhodomonas_salina.2
MAGPEYDFVQRCCHGMQTRNSTGQIKTAAAAYHVEQCRLGTTMQTELQTRFGRCVMADCAVTGRGRGTCRRCHAATTFDFEFSREALNFLWRKLTLNL